MFEMPVDSKDSVTKSKRGGARVGAGRKARTAVEAAQAVDSGKVAYVRADRAVGVQTEFIRLLNEAGADDATLAKRIAEGLGAEETVFAKFEGKITDERNVTAWGERRAYAELVCKIKRITGQEEAPASFPDITVNIIHVGKV